MIRICKCLTKWWIVFAESVGLKLSSRLYEEVFEMDGVRICSITDDESYESYDVKLLATGVKKTLSLIQHTDPISYSRFCRFTKNIFVTDHFFFLDFKYSIWTKTFFVNLPKEEYEKNPELVASYLACLIVQSVTLAKVSSDSNGKFLFSDYNHRRVATLVMSYTKRFATKLGGVIGMEYQQNIGDPQDYLTAYGRYAYKKIYDR